MNSVLLPLTPIALALATLCIRAEAQPSTSPTEERPTVIVIKGSKNQERVQDAPLSASVFDGAAISRWNLERLADYTPLVPNVSMASAAGPGLGALVLRGLYTGLTQQTATTAVLVGETPVTASGGLSYSALTTVDLDLADVERVDVLKGPQGTLYGAGSLGGLVRVVPRPVDLRRTGGRVMVGASQAAGGDSGHAARATVNVALVPHQLGFSVSAVDRADPGFTRNVVTGSDHLGRTDAQGASLAVQLRASDDVDLRLRLLGQSTSTRGAASQDHVVGTSTPALGPRTYAATFDRGIRTDYGIAELGSEFRLDAGTVHAILSRARIKVGAFEDYTAAYAPLVAAITDARTVFGVPLNSPPFVPQSARGAVEPTVRKLNFELRFASRRLGAIEYLAGLYLTRETNGYATHNRLFDGAGQPYAGQVLGFDVSSPTLTQLFDRSVLLQSDLRSRYRETALFGSLTYHLRSDLDATMGLRRARHSQQAQSISPPPGVGFINLGNYRIESQDSATTFLATLQWRPAAHTSYFLRAASGYRPGGTQATPNPPPTYAPDRVLNLEAGVKGSIATLRYEAAVFHIDWDRVQMNALAMGVPVVRNGGRAKADGLEAQIVWQPTTGLQVGANLGLNHARLKSIDAATTAATGGRPGDPLPNTPRVTAAAWADAKALLWGRGVDLGLTVKHTGRKPASYDGDVLNVPFDVPAFTTFDLRASTALGNAAVLRLGVDNATDRNGISGYSTLQVIPGTVPTSTAWLIRPRTVTVSVTYAF